MLTLKCKKPRRLKLSDKNLNQFPSFVYNDTNIVSLDLSNNHIREIPADIGKLRKLRYLNLENNSINELHNGILHLPSLKEINLKGNPIKHLPAFLRNNLKAKILIDQNLKLMVSRISDEKDQSLLNEIDNEVKEMISHNTFFDVTREVPTLENLTFSRKTNRLGKSLESCVLFIDIRDSVEKNMEYSTQELEKMYSSFVYGVLKLANAYNGHVRNIIGDRVMIVFDQKKCCDNAIKCANGLMCFVRDIMSKILKNKTIECGIGIHYGEMYIIKVGLTKKGSELPEYKNMVWIGEPANLASRLTDQAGKKTIPHIIISDMVYRKVNNRLLKEGFVLTPNDEFKDVNFKVYGRN